MHNIDLFRRIKAGFHGHKWLNLLKTLYGKNLIWMVFTVKVHTSSPIIVRGSFTGTESESLESLISALSATMAHSPFDQIGIRNFLKCIVSVSSLELA